MINQVKREMANWKWNLQHLQQSVSISNDAHVVFLKYKELQTDGKNNFKNGQGIYRGLSANTIKNS